MLNGAHDAQQLQRTWLSLEESEREMPELAVHAAQRLITLGGDPQVAREWLLPVWDKQNQLGDALKVKLVRALEVGLDSIDSTWLARIEAAQRANPREVTLQYLAAMACMKRQLWGKAQQLMGQAAPALQDRTLRRNAWCAVASLAEMRGDTQAAAQAWKKAATE
jgi:HemY protein